MSSKKILPIVILHGLFHDSLFDVLKEKKIKNVFVLEGRPGLEGARVLCAQLKKKKIEPVLIADNMAGFCFLKNHIKEAWLAYQEERDESLFCPTGSLILAILAKHHHALVRAFPIAKKRKVTAPPEAIFSFAGKRVAAKGVKGFVPLLEDVPKKYIAEIYL